MAAAKLSASVPRVYLGTMTFAWSQASTPVGLPEAQQFLELFKAAGGDMLDSARIYAGGDTEPLGK